MNMKTLLQFAAVLGLSFALSACAAFSPPKTQLPTRDSIISGEQITVQGKQNVYAVARQYNVSMRDLIVLNDLKAPFILHNGDHLTLPAGVRGASGESMPSTFSNPATIPGASAAPVGAVESSTLAPVQSAPVTPTPITPAAPSHGETHYMNAPKPQSNAAPSGPSAVAPAAKQAAITPEVLSTPSPTRPMATTAAPAIPTPRPSAPSPASDVSFVWPVQGPVLSGFGPKGQGLNNDGINIGAPKGAPVVAAANGIVVYAGNEMKGFGNLILIRHQGGWVTAYAHLDRALVAKDAVVAQGDMIGTVGSSGAPGAAQLHFEMRSGGKPVDPNSVIKG
jgi:murein DD-endopeptidase MepM/ murein hydrolase activator NlpD